MLSENVIQNREAGPGMYQEFLAMSIITICLSPRSANAMNIRPQPQ